MIGLLELFWITQESYPRNYSKCWKQQRGLLKSMDPDSEVKKRERLTKSFLKLKDNKLTGVIDESSNSKEPKMIQKCISKTSNFQRPKRSDMEPRKLTGVRIESSGSSKPRS